MSIVYPQFNVSVSICASQVDGENGGRGGSGLERTAPEDLTASGCLDFGANKLCIGLCLLICLLAYNSIWTAINSHR